MISGVAIVWSVGVGIGVGFGLGLAWGATAVARRIFMTKGGVYVPRSELYRLAHGEITLHEHLDMYQGAVKAHLMAHPVPQLGKKKK